MKNFRPRALNPDATPDEILAEAGQFFDSPQDYLNSAKPEVDPNAGIPPEVDASIPDYSAPYKVGMEFNPRVPQAPVAPRPVAKAPPQADSAPAKEAPARRGLADRLAEGRVDDAGADLANNVSSALYSTFSRTPFKGAQRTNNYEQRAIADDKVATADAMNDPASAESVRAREFLAGTGVGQALKARLGAQFESLSAAQLPGMDKILAMEKPQKVDPTAEARSAYLGQLTEESKARTANMGAKPGYDGQALADALKMPELAKLNEHQAKMFLDQLSKDKRTAALAESAKAKLKAAQEKGSEGREGMATFIGGERYQPRGGVAPDKQIVRKAQETAGLYGATIDAMDDLGRALDAFVRNPTVETRGALAAKASSVGGALNVAQGQGVMSEGEYARRMADLGVPGATADTFAALFDKVLGDDDQAAKAMLARLKSVRESTLIQARGKLRAYNYEPASAGGVPPPPMPKANAGPVSGQVQTLEDGTKVIELPDGSFEEIDEDML